MTSPLSPLRVPAEGLEAAIRKLEDEGADLFWKQVTLPNVTQQALAAFLSALQPRMERALQAMRKAKPCAYHGREGT